MTDQSPSALRPAAAEASLYAETPRIHPRKVAGPNRALKTAIVRGLLLVLALVPWLRWDRGPGQPDQAVLFDFVGMRAYFLDLVIWPQEFYFLTGILVIASIGLFLVTALRGRVWCGFACPQTVWTDIFVWIERQVEGDRNARLKLDKSQWTADKLFKRATTHALWLVVSLLTAIAFMGFFNDAPTATAELLTGQAGFVLYGFVLFFAGMTYTLAGWAREQVCIYMCPWPRLQGAMLDHDSIIVAYDPTRGEGRGHARQGQSFDGRGHCVDCKLCVHVCPVGIDIRDGMQMECIGCGLCVDACNTVMPRFGLPLDLVGWRPLSHAANDAERRPAQVWYRRPRLVAYVLIIAATLAGMAVAGASRRMLDLNVLHDRAPVAVALSDGGLRNDYTVKVINREGAARRVALSVVGLTGGVVEVQGQDGVDLAAAAGDVTTYRVSVRVPAGSVPADSVAVDFRLTDLHSGAVADRSAMFIPGGR